MLSSLCRHIYVKNIYLRNEKTKRTKTNYALLLEEGELVYVLSSRLKKGARSIFHKGSTYQKYFFNKEKNCSYT